MPKYLPEKIFKHSEGLGELKDLDGMSMDDNRRSTVKIWLERWTDLLDWCSCGQIAVEIGQ